ncbi:MAG: hypothetical protein WC100_00775 [Sterolibacterium sp.]
MIAIPIIPGLLYRVRGLGHNILIIADHGCTASMIVAEMLLPTTTGAQACAA